LSGKVERRAAGYLAGPWRVVAIRHVAPVHRMETIWISTASEAINPTHVAIARD